MTHLSPDLHPGRASVSVADLVRDGLVLPQDAAALKPVEQDFRVRVTAEMRAASIAPGVARQFLPTTDELVQRPEDMLDPIGDDAHSPVKGLTHRYPDRAILHVTKTCDVYCRFCFRRETVGDTGNLPSKDLDAALDYIARTPDLWEIVLTGGDPLVLSPRRLADLVTRLAAIPHIEVLRFHTRVPVVAPGKITTALTDALKSRLTTWMVIHTNHADELTPAAQKSIDHLAQSGIGLLSQTVLLRGVNDTVEDLSRLFRTLYRLRVKPYYLHHCDMARGAGHFRTTIAAGQDIMRQLRGRLSGPCLPTYVLDIPGGHGKSPIGAGYIKQLQTGDWEVTDWTGNQHLYRDPD